MPPPLKKRLYVGCGISGLPSDKAKAFLDNVSKIKDKLRGHFKILDFLGTDEATPEEVYYRDIVECVGTADMMLAICDHPSTGLGFEMCHALFVRKIPVLAIAAYESNVSRLVLGIHGVNVKLKYNFVQYREFSQIPEIVVEQFEIRHHWIEKHRSRRPKGD